MHLHYGKLSTSAVFCMFKTDFAKFLHFNTFDKDAQNAFWDKRWLLSMGIPKVCPPLFSVTLIF